MKKVICILLIIIVLVSMLTGCIDAFTCDFCGIEGFMNQEDILGTKITYCDNCKRYLDELRSK